MLRIDPRVAAAAVSPPAGKRFRDARSRSGCLWLVQAVLDVGGAIARQHFRSIRLMRALK
jgi:hypothetical protein